MWYVDVAMFIVTYCACLSLSSVTLFDTSLQLRGQLGKRMQKLPD